MAKNDPEAVIKETIMDALRTGPIPDDFQARKGTFQFFRSRLLPNSQLHEVTFENNRGEHQRFLCLAVQEPDGTWQMVLSCNISGINHVLRSGDEPHVELGGSNLWMGGYVVDCGQGVTHVRLVSGNGNILEDTVQDGLVVFAPEQGIPLPIQVELYDSAGNLVGTHPWPYIPPSIRSQFYEKIRSYFPEPDSFPFSSNPDL